MYATTEQKAFGESYSELHYYITMPEDQGNSVKFKIPWHFLMRQDKFDSEVETLKCLKYPKLHSFKLLS